MALSQIGKNTLLKDAVGYFKLDKVDIDNLAFKLFAKVSVGVFIAASAISIASSYWGKPIQCKDLDDKDYDNTYCWIHGSYHLYNTQLEFEVNKGERCFRNDGKTADEVDEDMASDTAFYLWVSITLFLHGLLFMVPDQIWKSSEGGVLEQFKSVHEKSEDDAPKHAKEFKEMTKNQNNRYFFTFMACELFNILIAAFNFYLIDKFVAGKFVSYGHDVLQYYTGTLQKETITYGNGKTKDVMINPMCNAFPTVVNCILQTGGVNGQVDRKSHICLLAQNIINEKIYLVLWFWFIILFIASGIIVIYRCLAVTQPWFRRARLQGLIRTRIKTTALEQIEKRFNGLGDWFLLCQIGRNSTPYYFRAFLREVAKNKNENGGANGPSSPLMDVDGVDAPKFPTTDALNAMESGRQPDDSGAYDTLEMKPKFN